jgi:hypothetical protein
MTKLLLKKSSVVGKIPLVGDLSYGELALNYADGKLYYKTSSNTIEAFLDSANIVSLIQANSVDSSEVINLIDSDYIQLRQADIFRDSAFITNIVDADYVNSLGVVGTDSAAVLQLISDNSVDSAEVINLIDSDYINVRVGEVGIDSAAVTAIIDSDYVQARSAPIGTANMVVLNTFSGDSSTTAFTLTKAPTTEQHAIVTVNGVLQQVDDYSLSGTTLTFGTAPVTGDDIEVRTLRFQNGTVELRDYKQYVFQPSALTTSFSGSDINGDVLAYDEGKVEVYLNGIQLVQDLDFTANNDTTVTLLGTGADSGDTLTVTSLAKASFIEGEIDSAETSLTSTATNQVVDTMSTVNHRTAKYIVQMTQNSRYHSQEVLLVHDGTTVHMTTYAEIYTESDLGSVDADISGGNVRLLVSPNYANTNIRTKRIDLGV